MLYRRARSVNRFVGILFFLILFVGANFDSTMSLSSTASAQTFDSSELSSAASTVVVPDTVKALQETIVKTIAKAERSVVAVARSKRIAQPKATRRAQPPILGQPNLPGANQPPDPLGQLRTVQPFAPPYAYGSGVVIDSSGLVLTQYLVVNSADDHFINDVDGNRYQATIRAADPRSGLALLAVNPRELAKARERAKANNASRAPTTILPALAIGDAEKLNKGDFVISLGNPYAIQSDGQPTSSWGTISNTARKAATAENFNNAPDTRGGYRTTLHHFGSLIQTDAKLGWNSAGGALVNLSGELVGITTTAASIAGHEQPAGYAIPLNQAMRRIVQTLSEGKEAEYGLIGVTFSASGSYAAGNAIVPGRNFSMPGRPGTFSSGNETTLPGVRLDKAYFGGPGYRGGLRSGDYILSIDEIPITDADTLQLVVGSKEPGDKINVSYLRSKRQSNATVELGKAYVLGERIVTKKPNAWRGMRVDYPTAVPGDILHQVTELGQVDPLGCVAVVEVEPNSISAQSGVKPYMFISHVGGKRVSTPKEFYAATAQATDTVKIKFTEKRKANVDR